MWMLRVLDAQRLASTFSHAATSAQAHAVNATDRTEASSIARVRRLATDLSDPATADVGVRVTAKYLVVVARNHVRYVVIARQVGDEDTNI